MELAITYVFLALVLIVAVYLWFQRPDSRLPPFPVRPWPLVGNLPHLEADFRTQFKRWRKQCGDIFSLYMGPKLCVVLNGYELNKEALVLNGEICNDRPFIYYDVATGYPGHGLTFSTGVTWKEQRDVTVSILRHLGMGKNILAQKSLEIVEIFNEELAKLKGQPADISMLINVSVANVICSIIIGHRFEANDESFRKVLQYLRENIKDSAGTSIMNYIQFLQYIPIDLLGTNQIKARSKYIMDIFVQKFVRQKGYDEYDENNLDNYIAAYIEERDRKLNQGMCTTMNDANLKRMIYDIFGAAVDTVGCTLYWCTLYFLHYPGIQEKIYQEIQHEVGTQRLPNMKDRVKLVYLNAFINELQRLSSVSALGLLRKCNAQVTLKGYTIPKGTYIITNLDSVHFDKKRWGEDAMNCRPERFIDEHGKLKSYEEFVPFSLGKRGCVGEALARMELFLFIAAMVQRFKFVPVDSANIPPLQAKLGMVVSPVSYNLRVLERTTVN